MATASRMGLTSGFDLRHVTQLLGTWMFSANAERLCDYVRPVLLVGSPKNMDLQSVDRRNPKFQRTLQTWSEQGRWFLHEDPHHSWSQNTQALQNLEVSVWS